MKKKTTKKETKLKVLILEDSPYDLELMRKQLSTVGYHLDVTHVENKAGYTSALRENRFDLILADFKLPDFDGFGALEISRELCPETPCIIVSGIIGEETAVELLKRGAVDYVLKDKPERLPFAIKRTLEEAEVKAEYQKAAETLRESEAKMHSIYRVAPTGIGVVINRVLKEVNPRICEMTGYTREELIDKNARILYPSQEEYEFVGREKYDQIREKGNGKVETRWQKKDGTIINILLASAPIDLNDHSKGITFTALDITERKQAEEALFKSESVSKVLLDGIPESAFLVDLDGTVIAANATVARRLNQKKDEMVGSNIFDAVPKEVAELRRSFFDKAVKTGKPVQFQDVRFDRIIDNRINPIFDRDGKISMLAIIGIDITDHKQAEEALRASEKHNAFLAQTAFELVELTSIQNIYKYTVQKLYELFEGNSIVALAEFNHSTNRWKIQQIKGVGKKAAELSHLLGFDINNMEGDISTKYYKQLSSGKVVEIDFDLPGLFNNKIPASVGNVVKKMISAEKIYCVAYEQDDQILGNITLITNKKSKPINTNLIEAFIQQVSTFIKKQKAEERLKESENFYKVTFEEAAVGIAHVYPNGDFFKVNKKFCDIIGYDAAELTQMNIKDISFPDDTKKENEYIRQVLSNKIDSYIIEKRYLHKKGHLIWVKLHSNVVKDQHGEIKFAVASISEITDRKQAEADLKESEAKFRSYIENAPDGVFIADEKGKYTEVNQAACEMTGYTAEELLTKSITEMLQKDQVEKGIRHFQEINEKGIARGEFNSLTKNGESATWHVAAVKLSATRFLGFVKDITKRKRAEEALIISEEMMRNSQSVAHICSYSTNLNENEIEKSAWVCSPEFYKIFGIDENYPHTIAGWANFIHPDYREEIVTYHENVIKERKSFNREYKIIRVNDGAERWVHGTGELIFDVKGHPVRMHGAIQDITDRKWAEEALKESEEKFKKLSSFTFEGIVIHENAIAIDVNPSFVNMLGYEREELIGLNLFKLIHPDDHEKTKINLSKQVASPYQIRAIRKDGSIFYAEIEARNISYNGEFFRVACVRDITERKKMLEELVAAKEKAQESDKLKTAFLNN